MIAGDAKKTAPSPTNAAPIVKKLIVPKNCDVPIHHHERNIFDPQVCRTINWNESPAGSATKSAAVPSGTPGPSESKDKSTAKPMEPTAGGPQPTTTPDWVSQTLADARTVIVVIACCMKMLIEFHNNMPTVIFADARKGKPAGSYDKFDHQRLESTCT